MSFRNHDGEVEPTPCPQPFSKQQESLSDTFYKLREIANSKIEVLQRNPNLTDEQLNQYKTEIGKQVEALHLMISNYFGDCDRRKQRIEASVSQKFDVQGFSDIANQIV